jgi:hypothetical protein
MAMPLPRIEVQQVGPLEPDLPTRDPSRLRHEAHDRQAGDRLSRTALTDQSDNLAFAQAH